MELITTQEPFTIEKATGLERVSEDARQHTSTRDVMWLWVAANFSAPTLTIGFLNVLFGLGFWGSAAVIIGFTLVGSAIVAYFSTWGPQTGLVQMVISRFSFGYYGARVPAGLNGFTGIGWMAFNSIIGAGFLVSWSAVTIPMWLALAVLIGITTFISLFGYFLLQRFERFAWLLMLLPLGILMVVAAPHFNIGQLSAPALTSGLALVAATATFGGVVFAHVVSWGPLAADFTRRMPAETPARRVFGYAFIGLAAPCIALELLGALLTSCAGAGDPVLLASGPGPAIAHLLGNPLLTGVVLFSLTLSVIANNVPPSYSLPFSFQLLGLQRISRPVLTCGMGVLYLLLSLVLVGQFSENFEHFLLLVSYWLAAWASIEILEHWLRKGTYDLENYEDARRLPSGIAALVAMVVGLGVTLLGVQQTLFVGPLAQALGGADLGYPLAFVATGLCYYPLRRWERARHRQGFANRHLVEPAVCQTAGQGQEHHSIVGAWLLDFFGAPFVPHVAIFHADGTFLIHNPEAGDRHSSDSLGAGAWEIDQERPAVIVGQFQEINADRESGQYVNRLVVDLTLMMQGTDAVCGDGTATYFTPDGTPQSEAPHTITLMGTRILPSQRTRERRGQSIHLAAGTG